ncbi:ParB/Srx family N-terminal domain-containing protein [Nocardia sp. NPDC048505]|uniref:ParB/RepB/Spo0J family partition protein n=1 Tax=Nocardia sp. NPDC048505 TaxID=3155756 RepID=UPI0033F47D68
MTTAETTITSTSTDTVSEEAGALTVTEQPAPELEPAPAPLADLVAADRPIIDYVDPSDLELGDNIRTDVRLSKDFVASLGEHGNIHSILVWRREDGVLEVVDGQRRTLGLLKAGAQRAKVEIHPTREAAEGKAREMERIVLQWISGVHGDQLTQADRFGAIEQMLNLGLSATKVASKLGVSRQEAKAAAEVAKSEHARAAHTSGQLTLEQSATLAEFSDPDHIELLMRTAYSPGYFDQTAARIRERIAEQAAYVAAAAPWAESGYTVLEKEPWDQTGTYPPFHYLSRTEEGGDVGEEALTDPQHWAVWLEESEELRKIDSGEPISEADVDWSISHQPDAEPDEGLLHPDRIEQVPVWEPTYYCIDVEGAGLFLRTSHGANQRTDAGLEPAEIEAQAEAKRAQNRLTKVANKAARRATAKRRTWLGEFLHGRTSTPKGSASYATQVMVAARDILHGSGHLATEMLGADPHKAIENATPGRTGAILFALIAGGMEYKMLPHDDRPHYWRTRENSPGAYITPEIKLYAPYLEFVRGLGHELADIDRYVIGEITVEEFMDAEAQRESAEKATKAAEKAAEKAARAAEEAAEKNATE